MNAETKNRIKDIQKEVLAKFNAVVNLQDTDQYITTEEWNELEQINDMLFEAAERLFKMVK